MRFSVNISSLEASSNAGFNVQIESDNVLDALDLGVKAIKETIAATGLIKAPVTALPAVKNVE